MSGNHRLPAPLVSLGAAIGFLLTYAVPIRWNVGPEGRWWETLRQEVSRLGNRIDRRMGPRPITPGEYAGTLDEPPEIVEQKLWEQGFIRNPLARLKVDGDTPEVSSWVYRDSPLASRQLHLMLFRGDDVTTHVYAHEEASSVNPMVGNDHFNGDGQNVAAGVEWARAVLPLAVRKDTPEPPEGPWSEGR